MDIWNLCKGHQHIGSLRQLAWRVVECQHISATRKLVDNIEEHEILEHLLETKAKPTLPDLPEYKNLHYLLATPFRYPPLQYGSRFGRRFERSLWYGADSLNAAFGEVAYYRLLFSAGSIAKLSPSEVKVSAYSINIATEQGITLHQDPFKQYQPKISQKDSYQYSQALGTTMREANIEAFTYASARIPNAINIGVYTPRAFATRTPNESSYPTWACYTDTEQVEFMDSSLFTNKPSLVFSKEQFCVDGKLMFAANS